MKSVGETPNNIRDISQEGFPGPVMFFSEFDDPILGNRCRTNTVADHYLPYDVNLGRIPCTPYFQPGLFGSTGYLTLENNMLNVAGAGSIDILFGLPCIYAFISIFSTNYANLSTSNYFDLVHFYFNSVLPENREQVHETDSSNDLETGNRAGNNCEVVTAFRERMAHIQGTDAEATRVPLEINEVFTVMTDGLQARSDMEALSHQIRQQFRYRRSRARTLMAGIIRYLNDYFRDYTVTYVSTARRELLIHSYTTSFEFIDNFNSYMRSIRIDLEIMGIHIRRNGSYMFEFRSNRRHYLMSFSVEEIANFHLHETMDVTALYPQIRGELDQVLSWLNNFNLLLPITDQITRIELTAEDPNFGSFLSNERYPFIRLPIAGLSNKSTFAHEFGHAYFDIYFAVSPTFYRYPAVFDNFGCSDRIWLNIFAYSLGNRRYELVDDSNYMTSNVDDRTGHPYDNPSEFFASSFAAFTCSPERFIDFIREAQESGDQDKTTSGIMIWCYMRDNVFQGRFFSESDPFAEYNLCNTYVTGTQIGESLDSAVSDSNPPDNITAAYEISGARQVAGELRGLYP